MLAPRSTKKRGQCDNETGQLRLDYGQAVDQADDGSENQGPGDCGPGIPVELAYEQGHHYGGDARS